MCQIILEFRRKLCYTVFKIKKKIRVKEVGFLESEKQYRVWLGVLVVFCVLFLCVFGFMCMSDVNHYTKETKTLNEQVQSLSQELAKERNEMQFDDAQKVETIEKATYSAAKSGADVANLQNEYRDADDVSIIAENLDFYLDDRSFRVPWFDGGVWKFETTFETNESVFSVLWTCWDDDELCAYVTGNYNAQENVFTDMEKHMTVYGNSLIAPTTNGQEESSSSTVEDFFNEFDLTSLLEESEGSAS